MNPYPCSPHMHAASTLRRKLVALWILTTLLLALPATFADELRLLWQIAPGDREYVTADNTQRGLAYNPATGHVLVVNRAGGISVRILNARTGEEILDEFGAPKVLNLMDADGNGIIVGGFFLLNMIGVADDGAIYAGNLSLNTATTNFKVYRWESEDAPATLAFDGDPAFGAPTGRWGDTFDVRGAGNSTQVLIGVGGTATVAAILTTTDGKNFSSTPISNATSSGALGVAFGEGNTFWTKKSNQALRHVQFDLNTGQGTLLHSYSTTEFPAGGSPIGVSGTRLGAVVIATPDTFQLFDISNLSSPPSLVDSELFPTDNANGNGVGAVDFGTDATGDMVFALDTNNGIVAYEIVKGATPVTIITPPANLTVLEGGYVTLTVSATGTPPLSYQWKFKGNPIPGATGVSLKLTDVTMAQAGEYTVVVSNQAGPIESDPGVLTVAPSVRTDGLTLVWQLAPGDRAYVASDNLHRGVAINPVTKNVLLVSRTGGRKIYVLDANTGAELRQLNTDPNIVFGGEPGFDLNMIGVADDGAVYSANLTLNSASVNFLVYRWENDSADAAPVPVFLGDPSLGLGDRRYGDTFDVRGSGENTQILVASRSGNTVAILTPNPDVPGEFASTLVEVTDAPAGAFGLGLAFGEGNTFWGKTSSGALYHVGFDDPAAARNTVIPGTILHTYSTTEFAGTVVPISVDPVNKFLAGVSMETPDNLRLYDIADLSAPPVLLDQEFFPADNPNINGTGSVDFAGDTVVALDTNNGIVVMKVKRPTLTPPSLSIRRSDGKVLVEWTAPGATLQSATVVTGPYEDVTGATSPYEVNTSGAAARFFRLKQ
ncbi:MAG: immunoglobulin domain-containing protein [Verrucomicrobiota bacterium]